MLSPLLSPLTTKIPSLPTTHPQIYWKDSLLEEDSQEAFPLANDLSSCSLSSLKKDPVSHGLWRRLFLLILEFFFHHALSLYQTSASPYLLNHQQPCSWSMSLKMTQTSLAPTFCSSSQHIHLVHFRVVHTHCCQLGPSIGTAASLIRVSSVAQSCRTLCDPINCSTPGLPVHHQLPESTQTHVHWVGDAISSPP